MLVHQWMQQLSKYMLLDKITRPKLGYASTPEDVAVIVNVMWSNCCANCSQLGLCSSSTFLFQAHFYKKRFIYVKNAIITLQKVQLFHFDIQILHSRFQRLHFLSYLVGAWQAGKKASQALAGAKETGRGKDKRGATQAGRGKTKVPAVNLFSQQLSWYIML